MSELDHIIPPEIRNDEFYYAIESLAASEKLTHVLEIGSSAGAGSTEAFVKGLRRNLHSPHLYCLEVSKPRFEELRARYKSYAFVHCYNASSIPVSSFPKREVVQAFYEKEKTALNNYPLERVLGWLDQDLEYIARSGAPQNGIERIMHENQIDHFDLVLIDGSEFAGEAELNLVYGARLILLDDINGFKNLRNYRRLKEDRGYELVHENWELRNGYAIFKRKQETAVISPEETVDAAIDRALSLLEAEQLDKALACIEAARKKGPHTHVEYVYAMCLLTQGRLTEAKEALDRELQVNPANEEGRELLENINKELAKNRAASTVKKAEIHFFTLVLNGMPFLQHHLDVFKVLPFDWHWHIVEGAAELNHCTAWSKPNGGQITGEFHQNGLSRDGSTAYIDDLARKYPERISVYRKAGGELWNGKIEMVQAPLKVMSEGLLWEIDADELWTADQIVRMKQLFDQQPGRTAAYFHCYYFVGKNRYVSSLNTWCTKPKDWVRVWRLDGRPVSWQRHEPPVLVNDRGEDLAAVSPFTRDETLAAGITFQHFAYVTTAQVRFKEMYYGYRDAVKHWQRLQEAPLPLDPADYLPWAERGSTVTEWKEAQGAILADKWLKERSYSSMSVDCATRFEAELRSLFQMIRPKTIIETGTYLGRGTSTIIWKALRDLGLQADFTTCEVNPEHHRQAAEYFKANGMNIRAELGLTLPRAMLPSVEDIRKEFVEHKEFSGIYYDHDEGQRPTLYFAETNFPVPENLLFEAMKRYNFKPDFVLLDSAGHLGFAEFEYFLSLVQGECYLMLDDVYHCKHYKSLQRIKQDSRFTLLVESPEKFGFCIVKFTPAAKQPILEDEGADKDRYDSIIWLRTDSIGDNILAAGMLPYIRRRHPQAKLYVVCQEHIAELYEPLPGVTKVFGYNQQRLLGDEAYRNQFVLGLQQLQADVVLNSVYSRFDFTDFIALQCGAKEQIALEGDDSNIDQARRCKHNSYYSRLIPCSPGQLPEPARHREFLRALGIDNADVQPLLQTTSEDEAFADAICMLQELQKDRTIAVFPSAQWETKVYPWFGQVLTKICRERGFKVVGLGSKNERESCQTVLDAIGVPATNLCGKLSFRQSAALLKRCRLGVGSDSGLAHAATAVGVPSVVVLGGGHFGRFHPYSPLTSIACLPLSCYQCNWRCRYQEPLCIRALRPEIVSTAVQQVLDEASPKVRIYAQGQSLWQPTGGPQWQSLDAQFAGQAVQVIYLDSEKQASAAVHL